jgi:hypothetical protein
VFSALQVVGPGVGGFAIGWLIGLRTGLPFTKALAANAWWISALALSHLLLTIILAGGAAALAALLGTLAGVTLYCAFIARLALQRREP